MSKKMCPRCDNEGFPLRDDLGSPKRRCCSCCIVFDPRWPRDVWEMFAAISFRLESRIEHLKTELLRLCDTVSCDDYASIHRVIAESEGIYET